MPDSCIGPESIPKKAVTKEISAILTSANPFVFTSLPTLTMSDYQI
jgi:hypothetical protein